MRPVLVKVGVPVDWIQTGDSVPKLESRGREGRRERTYR